MKPQPTPARIPESMGPDEIGPHLRLLREKFNLTPQNVSERLHIRVRYIAAIEEAKYQNMPGKVYARGYVHTYAEFLGLDPEQVVTQCFPPISAASAATLVDEAAPPVAIAKPVPVSASAFKPFVQTPLTKPVAGSRAILKAVVIFSVLAAGYALFSGESSSPHEEETSRVAPVPESMLESVRGEIMPNAQNYHCLTDSNVLSCYFAQDSVRQLEAWQEQSLHPFAADIAAGVIDTDAASAVSDTPESPKTDATSSDAVSSKLTVPDDIKSGDISVPAKSSSDVKAADDKATNVTSADSKPDKPDALKMPDAKPSSEADSDDAH